MPDVQEENNVTVAADPVPVKSDPVIYCGPSLPRQYGLTQYQIYNNGLPANVKEAVDKCASIGALIVPVADLAATRLAIAKTGSAQYAFYQQITKEVI